MPTSSPVRKVKVILADFAYRRDLDCRLLLAQLNRLELDVLREIMHHSLSVSVESLTETLNISLEKLLPILDHLSEVKLFKRQGMTLLVNREIRKVFEFQLIRFEEDFEPNLDFMQQLLNRVPIHLLPVWYAIPRVSHSIFESIVEKYLFTPKIYRNYIEELQFDDPRLKQLIQDVYTSPHLKLTAAEIIEKYKMTREYFEECLLLLEYHFVCCLCYQKGEVDWQEIVTPFWEWENYLKFERTNQFEFLQKDVKHLYAGDFLFLENLENILKKCENKKVKPQELETSLACEPLIQKLLQLNWLEQDAAQKLHTTAKGLAWIEKNRINQVSELANHPSNVPLAFSELETLWNKRNIQLVEKSLKPLAPNQWILGDSFLASFSAPLGDKEQICLKNKGKKWRYALPTYTTLEKQFIYTVIFERLSELGVVAIGQYEDQLCFSLTPFGKYFLEG